MSALQRRLKILELLLEEGECLSQVVHATPQFGVGLRKAQQVELEAGLYCLYSCAVWMAVLR